MACLAFLWAWRTALVLQGATVERIAFGSDTRGDLLVVGCVIALARSEGWLARIPRVALTAGGAVGCLYVAAFAFAFSSTAPATALWSGYTVQTVAVAMLVVSVTEAPLPWILRALQLRPLIALGMISYGFYLWHYLIWIALSPYVAQGPPLGLVIVLTVTLAMASLSYALVERPALNLRHRLPAGYRSRDAATQAPALAPP